MSSSDNSSDSPAPETREEPAEGRGGRRRLGGVKRSAEREASPLRRRKRQAEEDAVEGEAEGAAGDGETTTGRLGRRLRSGLARRGLGGGGGGRGTRRSGPIVDLSPEELAAAEAAAGPMASEASFRPRHRLVLGSFLIIVALPVFLAAAYLWLVAKDQFASTVGFSVRREDASAAADILGGLSGLTKSSSSDTDILYEYLRSQKLVADMDARLDLRALWSKPFGDPVFTFDADGSIEDLLDYWQRMVRTSYDSTTGLIEVRVLAFEAPDATRIAQALLDESARMINDLSAAAREDAVRYAREELTDAENRLRTAREAVTEFRVKNQIVDPTTDFQTQAGLITTLETQLAEAQIEIDLLAGAAEGDPRLVQATRRAEVILARIAAERAKVGADGTGRKDFAALAADYERLLVDREFAQESYVAALTNYDSARAESQRTSRYLASHVLPTTAEVSRFPERWSILGLLALFLGLVWSIGTLIAYSVKDRR